MALVSGGDVFELAWQNANVGSGTFIGVATEDSTLILGGMENEDNGAVDSASRLIVTKVRKVGSFEGVFSNNMAAGTPEFEQAQALQNDLGETTWTFGWTNGENYSGSGVIKGKPQLSGSKATFSLKIESGAGFSLQQ